MAVADKLSAGDYRRILGMYLHYHTEDALCALTLVVSELGPT